MSIDYTASNELYLYIVNTGDYYPSLERIYKRILIWMVKGEYDRELANKAFMHLVNVGAKDFSREFGGVWNKNFTVDTRWEVAREIRKNFENRATEFDYLLPKKYSGKKHRLMQVPKDRPRSPKFPPKRNNPGVSKRFVGTMDPKHPRFKRPTKSKWAKTQLESGRTKDITDIEIYKTTQKSHSHRQWIICFSHMETDHTVKLDVPLKVYGKKKILELAATKLEKLGYLGTYENWNKANIHK